MKTDSLKQLLRLCLFVLAQALVFNRILIFGCATPLLYVYFVITFPRSYPQWGLLLWSFVMGLLIDMFANTPGIACASLTLIALLQPYMLKLFLPRDADEHIAASAKTLGWSQFASLASILTLIYCTVFYTIEAFTFFNWLQWLQSVGGSTVLTMLLILTFETVKK